MTDKPDLNALTPLPIDPNRFNSAAVLPYGVTIDHIYQAMTEFINFLGFINEQLMARDYPRLETMLMQANFSSVVGEFMGSGIPKFCPSMVKNQYHNGHPDLLPSGLYPNNSVKLGEEGIEIKASRYLSGWQGHNPEDTWLMVFVFDGNRPGDAEKWTAAQPYDGGASKSKSAQKALNELALRPFSFLMVVGAKLEKSDWSFAGRSATSRRTITASVTETGRSKMMSNWIYKSPRLP